MWDCRRVPEGKPVEIVKPTQHMRVPTADFLRTRNQRHVRNKRSKRYDEVVY